MTKNKMGFSAPSNAQPLFAASEQVFPEHMNHDYYQVEDEPSANNQTSMSPLNVNVDGNSKLSLKKESNLSIGSWAMARGRRY